RQSWSLSARAGEATPIAPWNDDVGAYPSCERAPAHSFDEIAAAGGAVGQLVPPSSAEISDHHYCRLPRARPERPRCRAARQRDELAPFHSSTSSARASSVGGTSRPSAFATIRYDSPQTRRDFTQEREALTRKIERLERQAGGVASRARKAVDDAGS